MAWEQIGNIQGPIGPLDLLTDVTAPATTVAGKVLGTSATGQWAPVPDAMLAAYPEATVYDPAVTYNDGDYVLNDGVVWSAGETINPGDSEPPTLENGGDWFWGPVSVTSVDKGVGHVEDRLNSVSAKVDLADSIARDAVPMDVGPTVTFWQAATQYQPGDIVLVPSSTDPLQSYYFSSDIAQTGGTAPSRDNVATWSLIDGVSLVQNKSIIQRALDDLVDVAAPPSTPAGKVLGTTAVGAWAPIDPPSPGWGRWIGTQAEYDAIVTKDPTVLYIVSSVA